MLKYSQGGMARASFFLASAKLSSFSRQRITKASVKMKLSYSLFLDLMIDNNQVCIITENKKYAPKPVKRII